MHDGNKKVSDLVSYQTARGVPAHYEYAPFGELTVSTTNTAFTAFNVADANPFRFSSEYSDDTLGLVYYNYRHYNPKDGRWICEEQLNEMSIGRWYVYVNNSSLGHQDFLGLLSVSVNRKPSDDPMVMRLVVTPEDIGEGCELNFIYVN